MHIATFDKLWQNYKYNPFAISGQRFV